MCGANCDCVQMERLNNSSIHNSLQVVCVSLRSAEGHTPPCVKCKCHLEWSHMYFSSQPSYKLADAPASEVQLIFNGNHFPFESRWTRFIFYSRVSTQDGPTCHWLIDWLIEWRLQSDQIIHSFLVVHRFYHQGKTTRCGSWMCWRGFRGINKRN